MDCSTPGLPVHHQLSEFTQTHVHRVSDAIQPSHPLSSPSPPALNFPSIRVFSCESVFPIRWPKSWCFSFNISPSNEYSGLIFRMDWFDLLPVQGPLKSLLHQHSSKASILWCSALPRGIFTHNPPVEAQYLNHWTAKESLCSCVRVQSCLTFCKPLDCRPPDSSVHGFFRTEYWSGLLFPPPRDLPDPGTEPASPVSAALQVGC